MVGTVIVLVLFRVVETWIGQQMAADMTIAYARDRAMHEDDLRAVLGEYGFRVKRIGWKVSAEQHRVEHRLKLVGTSPLRTEELAARLKGMDAVLEYTVEPRGD
jgi:hypothetical protein